MVVTGDITQIDLPRGHRSGLVVVSEILATVKGDRLCHLPTEHDVVRHTLVQDIVRLHKAYAEREARGVKGARRREMPRRSLGR